MGARWAWKAICTNGHIYSNFSGGADDCYECGASPKTEIECLNEEVCNCAEILMKAEIEDIVLPMPKLKRHPMSEKFHEALQRIGELHDKKQSDYGKADDPFANIRSSSEWGITPWVGALVRLNDKVKRLQKAAQGGTLSNEGVVDSLEDIAVYALIAKVIYEEEERNKETKE